MVRVRGAEWPAAERGANTCGTVPRTVRVDELISWLAEQPWNAGNPVGGGDVRSRRRGASRRLHDRGQRARAGRASAGEGGRAGVRGAAGVPEGDGRPAHGRAAADRAVQGGHDRPAQGRGRRLVGRSLSRSDVGARLPDRHLDRGAGQGLPKRRQARRRVPGPREGAADKLAGRRAARQAEPGNADVRGGGLSRPGLDPRQDPRPARLLRRALAGRLQPRPVAGPRAAPRRVRLPGRPVGRPAGGLAADRQAADGRVLPAQPVRARGRRPGRGQRAGDRVRELHVRAVDHGRGGPEGLPPAGAARGRREPDRADGHVPRAGHAARRQARADRRHVLDRAAGPAGHAAAVRRDRGSERDAAETADRRLRRRVRVRAVRVGNHAVVRENVFLLASLRARHPDPRARRPHGADLLRARPGPDRGQRARRVRGRPVPELPAVPRGGEHTGHARRAVPQVGGDHAGEPGRRGEGRSSTSSPTPRSAGTSGTAASTSARPRTSSWCSTGRQVPECTSSSGTSARACR